jgi:hypothetical protein
VLVRLKLVISVQASRLPARFMPWGASTLLPCQLWFGCQRRLYLLFVIWAVRNGAAGPRLVAQPRRALPPHLLRRSADRSRDASVCSGRGGCRSPGFQALRAPGFQRAGARFLGGVVLSGRAGDHREGGFLLARGPGFQRGRGPFLFPYI